MRIKNFIKKEYTITQQLIALWNYVKGLIMYNKLSNYVYYKYIIPFVKFRRKVKYEEANLKYLKNRGDDTPYFEDRYVEVSDEQLNKILSLIEFKQV